MMKKRSLGAVCIVAATVSVVCLAAAADNVTPTGANAAASKDGLVPAFAGRETPEQGWAYGKYRGEFWKHRDEKPLYSIDAANVEKYADHLSPGQIQLIKQRKGYRMDVYPAHRECQLPDVAEQNSRENLTAAKLDPGGSTLQAASLPGVAFPKPQNGAEAILNYEYRYRGVGIEWPTTTTAVSPRPGSDDWIMTMGPRTFYFPSGKLGRSTPNDVDQLSVAGYFGYNSPAAMAGQGGMQRQYFDKDSETFYYFPGQRRVRRMPAYTHDAPQIGYENQYAVDEANMFNGFIDRFDWKLAGQREMIVPYNDFGMYNFNAKLADVAKPDGLSEASRRYEMHRVWVVEATLKPTARHVASKKVFYLDEDSWLALVGEDYDAQGKLWKVREGYPIPVWELGGACDLETFVQYDLNDGRYVFDQSPIGAGKDIHWYAQSTDSRFKSDYYSAETLRSISER